ncbi:hypothetical protein JAAARDRAFT_101274, partial [Jaapia argillacea MUCL 33604]
CKDRPTPPRGCRSCVYLHCKKCCQIRQHAEKRRCPHSTHTVQSDESEGVSQMSSANTSHRDVFYDPSRPLTKAHYDARARAAQEYQVYTNTLAQQKASEEQMKRNVTILFWDSDDSTAEEFDVNTPVYPYFSLVNCPGSLRTVLGITEDSMIETYDVEKRRWVHHELKTMRDISDSSTLLYRARGIRTGKGMTDEEARATSRGQSKKRPPSTRKSAWPLRYTCFMSDGFEAMETTVGTLAQRFEVGFPGMGGYKKTCWNWHSRIWRDATDEQRHQAIVAGTSKEGEWRNLVKAVEKSQDARTSER